jgi:hypothetical protein
LALKWNSISLPIHKVIAVKYGSSFEKTKSGEGVMVKNSKQKSNKDEAEDS